MISFLLATTLTSASVCTRPTTAGTVITNIAYSALPQESKTKDLFYRLKAPICNEDKCKTPIEYEREENLKVIDIQCQIQDRPCIIASALGPNYYFWKKNAISPVKIPIGSTDCLADKIKLLVKGCPVPSPAVVTTITYSELVAASHKISQANELYKLRLHDCQEECDDIVISETAGLKVYTVNCSQEDSECKVFRIAGSIYSRPKGVSRLYPIKKGPFDCITDLIPQIFPEKVNERIEKVETNAKTEKNISIGGVVAGVVCSLLVLGGCIAGFLWWKKSQK
jgi:hypothetical protein